MALNNTIYCFFGYNATAFIKKKNTRRRMYHNTRKSSADEKISANRALFLNTSDELTSGK